MTVGGQDLTAGLIAPLIAPHAIEPLAESFRSFGRTCQGTSPLYERLALAVSDDPALLELAQGTTNRPVPNIFFAAVHDLLLREGDRLERFYSSIVANPDSGDPWPAFKAFCLAHRDAIGERLATRLCQTSEVQRCANLYPAFHLVAERAGQPVHFIEVGSSVGLNLLWNHYGYDYGFERILGAAGSSLVLSCKASGSLPPMVKAIPIASCIGMDLNPIDVGDEDQVRWMRALIWPEHRHRAERLDRAVAIAREHRPTVLRGSWSDVLPNLVQRIPDGEAVCVYHSYTLNQFTPSEREAFRDLLAGTAGRLDLYAVSLEWLTGEGPLLELRRLSKRQLSRLARCEQHGHAIDWVGDV